MTAPRLHPALAAARVDLVIFDMDGVLVDVSASYRQAIARTVRRYCTAVAGTADPRDAFLAAAPAVIAAWKAAGGFNNDWDLSAALAGAVLCRGADPAGLIALAGAVAAAGGSLDGVARVLGRVAVAAVRHSGDLGDPRDIRRIFQELYLGGPAFKTATGLVPVHVGPDAPGLSEAETAILSPAAARALARPPIALPLAIATGRPAAEARAALDRLGTTSLFAAVVTDDDVREQARRTGQPFGALAKPAAWPLLEAARRAAGAGARAAAALRPAYVGDLPDDMAAARAAGFLAVGVGSPAPAGADVELPHPDALLLAG